jgi:hypothetical protein
MTKRPHPPSLNYSTPVRNKMFAKRDAAGRFREMDDVGRSLAADRRTAAKTASKRGHGDQGDRSATKKK